MGCIVINFGDSIRVQHRRREINSIFRMSSKQLHMNLDSL